MGFRVHAIEEHKKIRNVDPPVLNFGLKRRLVVSITPLPLYPRERHQGPIEKEAKWVPEPVWVFWRREKFLGPAGI